MKKIEEKIENYLGESNNKLIQNAPDPESEWSDFIKYIFKNYKKITGKPFKKERLLDYSSEYKELEMTIPKEEKEKIDEFIKEVGVTSKREMKDFWDDFNMTANEEGEEWLDKIEKMNK